MYNLEFYFLIILLGSCEAQNRHETGFYFRVEPGARTCFHETGNVGQMLETQYEVIDGHHGDLDISFDIIDPDGRKLLADYKRTENIKILVLDVSGDYSFCLDNRHSRLNSKLVYIYVLVEDKPQIEDVAQHSPDTPGQEDEEEIIEWKGEDENGVAYYVEVSKIADSLTRTLMHVVRARHLMDVYGTIRTRDSYTALGNTYVVDVWSIFQIIFMISVGTVQVYMIKKLFNNYYM